MQPSPLTPPDDAVIVTEVELSRLATMASAGPLHLWQDGGRAWLTTDLDRPSFTAVHAGPVPASRVYALTPWPAVTVEGLRWLTGSRSLYTPTVESARKMYKAGFRFRHHPVRYWTFDRAAGTATLWVALRLTPLTASPWLNP